MNSADAEYPAGVTILNLDNRKNGAGTHWTVVWRSNDWTGYFDPIGAQMGGYPPPSVARLPGPIYSNWRAYMPPESRLCGYYALKWGKALQSHRPTTIEQYNGLLRATFGDHGDSTDLQSE